MCRAAYGASSNPVYAGVANCSTATTHTYLAGTHRLYSVVNPSNGSIYFTNNYNSNGNVTGVNDNVSSRSLAYTQFDQPSIIVSASGTLTFAYDADRARVRQTHGQAGVSDFTTYYVGNYEENQSEIIANGATPAGTLYEQRHYLNTPEGSVGLVIFHSRDNGLALPSGLAPVDHRYWHKDHLGSIAVITDSANQVKQKFAFDPWGNRIVLTPGTGDPLSAQEQRGYTEHEHLSVGFTHMNGRLYDPVTGRMLQADPIVQDALNGQNLNRYSYVMNNPLAFTDPTGFSWWTKTGRPIFRAVAAIAVAYMTGYYSYAEGTQGVFYAAQGSTGWAAAGNAAAAGFAAGGVAGGNIQSAVRSAFTGLGFYR